MVNHFVSCYATLCVHRDGLDKEHVSRTLELEDNSGEIALAAQKFLAAEKGLEYASRNWSYTTQFLVHNAVLTDHLGHLLKTIESKREGILRLQSEGYDIYVSCCIVLEDSGIDSSETWCETDREKPEDPNVGALLEVSSMFMEKLGRLNLDLQFDLYCL